MSGSGRAPAVPPETGDSVAANVTSHARRSARWTLLIGAVAFPLVFARNFVLEQFGDEVVGVFALVLLLVQGVHALFLPGGKDVFPALYPKLRSAEERSRCVTGYFYVVSGSAALALLVTAVRPDLLALLVKRPVDGLERRILQILIPCSLLSAMAVTVVLANMSFVWASVLQRAQLVSITAVASVMYVLGSDALRSDPLLWLGGTIVVVTGATTLVSSIIVLRTVRLTWRPMWPRGSVRFALFASLDAAMVYAYVSIDQYFVAHEFSVAKLGVYFLLLQIVRLVPVVVQQFGHLLLATFSKLLGTGAESTLASAYRRVSRLSIGVHALLSLVIVNFSGPLAAIFGEACAVDHKLLLCLAVAMNIDALRTVNCMALMAYERMQWVFYSKLLQIIVQLGLTIALIGPLGIYGIILAKGAGQVVQTGVLFVATARVRRSDRLLPPRVYFIGQAVVLASGWIAMQFESIDIAWSAAALVGGSLMVWFGGRFRLDELRAMMPGRRSAGGA